MVKLVMETHALLAVEMTLHCGAGRRHPSQVAIASGRNQEAFPLLSSLGLPGSTTAFLTTGLIFCSGFLFLSFTTCLFFFSSFRVLREHCGLSGVLATDQSSITAVSPCRCHQHLVPPPCNLPSRMTRLLCFTGLVLHSHDFAV